MKLSSPTQGLLATGVSPSSFPLADTSTTYPHNVLTLGNTSILTADAANSVGLVNGTNAQTFSVYNTFTAGTPDYERLEMFWSSNVAIMRMGISGTGSARNLELRIANSTNVALRVPTSVSNGMDLMIGTGSATTASLVRIGSGGSLTGVSGTTKGLELLYSLSDGGSTSTTVHNALNLAPTINYTAASRTGKVVLAYFNPTLTSQPSGNNAGISFSSAFTSSTFPAMRFHNVADEDTNFENTEFGWHIASNIFGIRTNKGGSGSARALTIYYSASTVAAIVVPGSAGNPIDLGVSVSTATAGVTSIRTMSGASHTATSGTNFFVSMLGSFAPTSTSTMAGRALNIAPTINYSNGTPGAGSVYCAYINPTNTALPTGLNAGLALSSTASGLTGAVMYFNVADETTNYEYVYQKFNTNVWEIGSVKGGSGTLRGIRFGITGNSIGFMGHAVQALPTAYTLTATQVPSRTLNANASATAANNNAVISQLIQDLQGYGLLQ